MDAVLSPELATTTSGFFSAKAFQEAVAMSKYRIGTVLLSIRILFLLFTCVHDAILIGRYRQNEIDYLSVELTLQSQWCFILAFESEGDRVTLDLAGGNGNDSSTAEFDRTSEFRASHFERPLHRPWT